MTYPSEPTRWTQCPEDAPELLRGAFTAGCQEGPNELQMRALALKLAALSSGAALGAGVAGAASAKAAGAAAGTTATGTAAAGGTGALSFVKIALSLALVGAAATGTVLLQRAQPAGRGARGGLEAPVGREAEHTEEIATPAAREAIERPHAESAAGALPQARDQVADLGETRAADGLEPSAGAASDTRRPNELERAPGRAEHSGERASGSRIRRARRMASSVKRPELSARAAAKHDEPVKRDDAAVASEVRPEQGAPSEIELLRSARAALDGRPRQAFRATEQHRDLYPQGVFAQERDALAVEALRRAGDLKLARELAEAFIRRYPSSPAAHRFRETMSLQ